MVGVRLGSNFIEGIELFVFDKDGTLIDLYTYWSNMVALRAEAICAFYGLEFNPHRQNLMLAMGVEVAQRRLKPEGPVGILPRAVVQRAAEEYLENIRYRDVSRECLRIFKEVDEFSKARLNDFIKPIKGAVELLTALKARGCKVAIATTDKTNRAQLAVEFLGWGNFIDLIVGADKIEHSKPAPDMLKVITDVLGVLPQASVMIGDAKSDIQMGANAGYKASIAVSSGLTPKITLMSLTPYVIEDVAQIEVS